MFNKWWSSAKPKLIGNIVWMFARLVGLSIRLRKENWHVISEMLAKHEGGIVVTWHGRSLIPANIFNKMGFWALISLSRDGEIQNQIFKNFGFQTIRGSSSRGAVRAALEAARKVKEGGILAFTPDGPRGPSKKVQPGALFIAQKAQCPIIPLGVSAKPRKFLSTWDSYMVPMPFAKACVVFGEPIYIPKDIDDEKMGSLTAFLEEEINRLEQIADNCVYGTKPNFLNVST